MSTMSQFLGGGGGGVGLGETTLFPMYSGSPNHPSSGYSPVTIGTQIFLRSGTYTDPANADLSVLSMEHLKLFDTTETTTTTVINNAGVSNIASNGAGTCVAINSPNTSTISYSTNNGVSWTNIVVGNGAWQSVIWTGARFVIANASTGGSAGMIFQSANGSTWTVGAGTLPPVSSTNKSLVTDGAGRVLYLSGTNTDYVSTDHGVTWSSFNNGTVGATFGFALSSVWVLFWEAAGSSSYVTAPLATPGTQTGRTSPFLFYGYLSDTVVSNNSNIGVIFSQQQPSRAYLTTDGINWSLANAPGSQSIQRAYWNGSEFYLSATATSGSTVGVSPAPNYVPYDLFKTTNFSTYADIKLVPALIGANTQGTGSVFLAGVGSDGRVFWSIRNSTTVQKPVRYWQETTTANFIGTNQVTTIASSSGTTALNANYWRIK